MNKTQLKQLFKDTDFVHYSGSKEELQVANVLKDRCEALGVKAELEPFTVPLGDVKEAHVWIDGVEIPCKGLMCCGSGEVEGELYFMGGKDIVSIAKAKDKIVLMENIGINKKNYAKLMKAGAKAILFTSGMALSNNHDIDERDLRAQVVGGERKVLSAMLNVKDVARILKNQAKAAKIQIMQNEYDGESHNVVAELPGDRPEWIVLSAHYDSTSTSHGAYDNMSGCAGLLGIMEYFTTHKHSYGLRFVFCGSEERGLLGSRAYAAAHEAELEDIALNINLDMIGIPLGYFEAYVSAEEALVHYISYMAAEVGFPVTAKTGVYPSDSTAFADKGVPSLSFARNTDAHFADIHCRYDKMDVLSMEQIIEDTKFIIKFTERMANSTVCPVSREMPKDILEKLDKYNGRK